MKTRSKQQGATARPETGRKATAQGAPWHFLGQKSFLLGKELLAGTENKIIKTVQCEGGNKDHLFFLLRLGSD